MEGQCFAFQVLPVIIYFSTCLNVLHYLGWLEAVITRVALLIKLTLRVTGVEALCAAGNIFVGQGEAPIYIRSFLASMTKSEIHAVMVTGFATISCDVMAAYVTQGISPVHLITATVMNAPASLAVSKILYPELGRSKVCRQQEKLQVTQVYTNIMEAAIGGAASVVSLVASITAHLITWVSVLYFINHVIAWLGNIVCYNGLDFEMICGTLLQPLVYLMGVEWEDAALVAQLFVIKTCINEFVAYERLATMIKTRTHCLDGPKLKVCF
ncbi:sodium/nucleoside cotransporter 1-like isoform X1 [Physella acuta]|uniref:sodium/nucleoside cotransporter 1-like isoform X1 n=1 Tax=Physella acuta TaxID=109671 RepID=UPI0027DAE000|nr:sodium/nucleoside cotransporter 1-like isoform X1 [Physella acuta]